MSQPEDNNRRQRSTAGRVAMIVGAVLVSLLLLVGMCFVVVMTSF